MYKENIFAYTNKFESTKIVAAIDKIFVIDFCYFVLLKVFINIILMPQIED